MPADSPVPELSAYELQRERTIAENKAKLRELGLDSGNLPPHGLVARESKKRKAERPPPPEPQRRSTRARREVAAFVVSDESSKTSAGGTDAARAARSGKNNAGDTDAARTAEVEEAREQLKHPDELPISTDDLRPFEREVWQVLREARNAKARAMERSMFIVCNDRTLCEMVRTVPACLEELQGLYGMGEKKLKAHGQMLLDALAPHIDGLRADHDTARREDDKRRGTDMAPTD